MNDDRFLDDARRDPRPEFARGLRERLRSHEMPATGRAWAGIGLRPVLVGMVAVVAAVAAFTLPSVRASAQAFLDLFRVRNFAAVSFDPERLKQLESGKLDVKELLGGQIESLKEPGAPRGVASAGEAGAMAGFVARQPTYLPSGFVADSAFVQGDAAARITIHGDKVRAVLDALDIRDLQLPPGLDGKTATVRVSPAVFLRYRNGENRLALVQSRSPEVDLPAGIDLPTLGEIGLRILGLAPAEARRIAQTTDWHTTVLVPVPTDASSFSQVDVNGNRGLLVETTRRPNTKDGRRQAGSVLLWSDGDMVFALTGRLNRVDLVQMASSVR
jgi:hypothetical protein